MAGFGMDGISARFVPDQPAQEPERPRFWVGSDNAEAATTTQPELDVQQGDPNRRPEVNLLAIPRGMRPGERAGGGQLLTPADAARDFRRRNRRAAGGSPIAPEPTSPAPEAD